MPTRSEEVLQLVARARAALDTPDLPPHQQINDSMDTFSGFKLDGLDARTRKALMDGLGRVNAIFSRYEIGEVADMAKICRADLDALFRIMRRMLARLERINGGGESGR